MIKSILLNVIAYLYNQVYNDKCTTEEMKSIYNAIVGNIKIDATVSDIANHYGQSESNVRNVIARTYIGKPKRRVFYDFTQFFKNAPKTWHNHSQQLNA